MRIAAAETGLAVNIRQLSGLNIPFCILAGIKGLNKVKFVYNIPVFPKISGIGEAQIFSPNG